MKGRQERGVASIVIHVVLAALALVLAFWTWTADKTKVGPSEVVALDVSKQDIQSLTFKDESRTVQVERRTGSDGEAYAWLTVTTRSKALTTNAAAAGGNPHGGMMPPPPPPSAPAPAAPAPAVATAPAGKAAAPVVKPTAAAAGPNKSAAPAKPAKGGDKSGDGKPVAAAPAAAPAPATAVVAPAAAPGSAASVTPVAAPPPAAPIHEIKETVSVKQFRGSDLADKMLLQFSPLRALRAIGTVDEAKAKELGLTDTKKELLISARGQTYAFAIGNTSYGSGDYYAKDGQGRVFLLSHNLIGDFEFAESRMMERRLHRFSQPDFTRVEVSVNGKTRTLQQQKREDAQNYFFADQSTPDKRDDSLKNWVDKVLRMAIQDYVAQGEEPKGDSEQVASSTAPAVKTGDLMTLRFFDGRKELGSAVLSRFINPKTNQVEYFARTETTIGMVRLLTATAESAVQDAEKW